MATQFLNCLWEETCLKERTLLTVHVGGSQNHHQQQQIITLFWKDKTNCEKNNKNKNQEITLINIPNTDVLFFNRMNQICTTANFI